jgi:hypothetical protein
MEKRLIVMCNRGVHIVEFTPIDVYLVKEENVCKISILSFNLAQP